MGALHVIKHVQGREEKGKLMLVMLATRTRTSREVPAREGSGRRADVDGGRRSGAAGGAERDQASGVGV
eukprot:1338503-Rhodomonas_salina.1